MKKVKPKGPKPFVLQVTAPDAVVLTTRVDRWRLTPQGGLVLSENNRVTWCFAPGAWLYVQRLDDCK